METKFNFNSQICTTRLQSERLLALGLKKETADMCWSTFLGKDERQRCWLLGLNGQSLDYDDEHFHRIPAWSLHRLICIYNYNQNNNGKYAFDSTYSEYCYNQIIHDISIKIQKGELKDLIY